MPDLTPLPPGSRRQTQGAVLIARTEGRWVSGQGEKEIWRIDRDAWLAR